MVWRNCTTPERSASLLSPAGVDRPAAAFQEARSQRGSSQKTAVTSRREHLARECAQDISAETQSEEGPEKCGTQKQGSIWKLISPEEALTGWKPTPS